MTGPYTMIEPRICNCASCNKELVSLFVKGERTSTDIAGRIKGRPYCAGCLEIREPPAGIVHGGDLNPGWENAVKAMEEG